VGNNVPDMLKILQWAHSLTRFLMLSSRIVSTVSPAALSLDSRLMQSSLRKRAKFKSLLFEGQCRCVWLEMLGNIMSIWNLGSTKRFESAKLFPVSTFEPQPDRIYSSPSHLLNTFSTCKVLLLPLLRASSGNFIEEATIIDTSNVFLLHPPILGPQQYIYRNPFTQSTIILLQD